MQTVTITSVSGVSAPYDIYVCNVYGNLCTFLTTINDPVPPEITINIPSPYDSAPAIGLKVISENNDCEKIEILYC